MEFERFWRQPASRPWTSSAEEHALAYARGSDAAAHAVERTATVRGEVHEDGSDPVTAGVDLRGRDAGWTGVMHGHCQGTEAARCPSRDP